ncbi:dual specificity protein phosphatase family protein [Piscirickettsia salmonis]|uniref:dual specificity protein phosphatase family protein n=1 Tax=Piscirickettsia salmonis TaxID=1238 RepID=UPI00375000C1
MPIKKKPPGLKLDFSNIDQNQQQGASAGPADDRHDLSHINLPAFRRSNVYLGPAAQLEHAITEKDIKYVINVGNVRYSKIAETEFPFVEREGAEKHEINGIQFLFCPAKDVPGQNLSQYFLTINQFLRDALKTGQPIFIHCHQGISRSASALLAFVMEESKCSLEDAIKQVKEHRKCIDPNMGFVGQLKTIEQSLGLQAASQAQSPMLFADRSAANSETAEEPTAEATAQSPQL